MGRQLWYVAYGSNISTRYFSSRFSDVGGARGKIWHGESWIWLPYQLYFATSSRTWEGSAVAFLSLEYSSSARSVGRAYLINAEEFAEVLAAEHGAIPLEWDFDLSSLPVGKWCPLPTRAKYNAVLRLPDIERRPAYTITTARAFEHRDPDEDYLTTCREGLADCPMLEDADAYIQTALKRSADQKRLTVIPPPPGAPLAWRTSLRPMKSTGYPTVHLGSDESWLSAEGPFPGRVEAGGRRVSVWLSSPQEGGPEGASPQTFRALGLTEPFPASLSCRIITGYPVSLKRLPGISEDVETADHVQVAPETARRLGRWALLITPNLSGPVMISPREHVPPYAARVSYATRELWDLPGDEGDISVLPLDEANPRRGSTVARISRQLIEAALGAPAVALRATEAVVGDEGRAVIRVDSTALDFLGVTAGEQVIV